MLFSLAYSSPLAVDLEPGSTASAYTDGKTIGTLMTIDCHTPILSGSNGPVALVESIIVSDEEKIDGDLDLILFESLPTAVVDNAIFAPSAADLAKIASGGVIRIRTSDWSDFSANSVASKGQLALCPRCKGAKVLYGLFVARSAITFAAPGSLKGKLTGFVN